MLDAHPTPPESLAEMERRHIARTLGYTGGNRRDAARLLGIARSTLLAKIRRYGLDTVTAGSEGGPGAK
ncbi:MAG: helix-turn-helix domain-containing protein [Gemmatimonadota bacterium]|nr:helix-turn-helix domain-containing protein [Gemmatimonadota bacterium]